MRAAAPKKKTEPPTVQVTRSLAGQSIPCPYCPLVCDRPKCQKEHPDGKGPCEHRPTMVEIPQTLARRVIPPLPTREWNGDGSLVAFVLGMNLHRRHLDESQRSMMAARATAMLEAEAEGRQKSGLKRGKESPSASNDAHGKTKGKTAETAAKLLNISASSVERARKVIADGAPELVRAVEAGEVKVSRAAQIAKLTPAEQREKIRSEGSRAEADVRQRDRADRFAYWIAGIEKFRRQFLAADPPEPAAAKLAGKLLALLQARLGAGKPT